MMCNAVYTLLFSFVVLFTFQHECNIILKHSTSMKKLCVKKEVCVMHWFWQLQISVCYSAII